MKHFFLRKRATLLGLLLSLSLILVPLSGSFATETTPAKKTVLPAIALTTLDLSQKTALNTPAEPLTNPKIQHNTDLVAAYEFSPTSGQFATNRWQKYITAIYTYAADVNFIVTTGYADGRIEQKTVANLDAVNDLIASAKASNESIAQMAKTSPDQSFKQFYDSVYLQPLITLFDGDLLPPKTLDAFKLDSKAPDLINVIANHYTVYKKGTFYLLTWSTYPNMNQWSAVSSSLTQIDKQLSALQTKQNESLASAGLIASKPSTYYVVSLFKDQTYSLATFTVKADAEQFATEQIKQLSKNAVKIVTSKTELEQLTKGLKLKSTPVKK